MITVNKSNMKTKWCLIGFLNACAICTLMVVVFVRYPTFIIQTSIHSHTDGKWMYVKSGYTLHEKYDNNKNSTHVQNWNSTDSELDYMYQYPEEVDLRIIVMTYNRASSLQKCLQSLEGVIMDGGIARLEIWIDRTKGSGKVNPETLSVAKAFNWSIGEVRVHIHSEHVGIYGQWIHTWRPWPNTDEVAIFLEDDVDLSIYAYKWIKAATHPPFYHPLNDVILNNFAGTALYEGGIKNTENLPSDLVLLHRRFGTWGFSPDAKHWRLFQNWYHGVRTSQPAFKPYVAADATFTAWYKMFEKQKKEDSMWSMWFIRYCWDNNLWTLYPNFAIHAKNNNIESVRGHYLAYPRHEAGLHYSSAQARKSNTHLLSEWHDYLTEFPETIPRYTFNGKVEYKNDSES